MFNDFFYQRLHKAYGDVSGTNEASYAVFIRAVLVGILNVYRSDEGYLLLEQKPIMGGYGNGPIDFAIKKAGLFIGITEAKGEAMDKGFAQNLIQLHTAYLVSLFVIFDLFINYIEAFTLKA